VVTPVHYAWGWEFVAEDVVRIRRFVAALVRRERALLLSRIAARTAFLVLVVAVLLVGAAVLRLDRGAASLAVVAAAGIGGWLAVAWPLLVEWRQSADAVRQARHVEALRPALRGRLVTSVAHAGVAGPGESEVMLGLVSRRAAAVVDEVPPDDVHPVRPALRTAVASGAAWAVALALAVALPGGTSAAVRFWTGGASALAEMAGDDVDSDATNARVGDLVLRYRYPEYTGLEPKVVPNSTGDAQGPPGTVVEVSARSAEETEAAGLVAYDEKLEAAVAPDGRGLTASFAIRPGEGSYHLVLYRGGAPEDSRDFAIVAEEDLPPDVTIDVGDVDSIEVAADQPFHVEWRARDDYGVRQVAPAIDGRELDVIWRSENRQAEIGDAPVFTPRDLGLEPGDRVQLTIVAWDNDTVSGSKMGSSRAIEVVVLGARGMDLRRDQNREELIEVMVPLLAAFLVEPWPAADTSGGLASWGETVAHRYEPLTALAARAWAGLSTNSLDRRLVESVLDTGRELVRYTQVSFLPGSADIPTNDAFSMTGQLRDHAIVAVEDALVAFHTLRKQAAMAELLERADDLTELSDRLDELLAQEDVPPGELASRLDQVDRMSDRLEELTERLGDAGPSVSVAQRTSEARGLTDEVREELGQRRTDEAEELSRRLSALERETAEAIRSDAERRSRQDSDADDQMRNVLDTLRALEADQQKLRSDVEALRESDPSRAREMADLWRALQERTATHRVSAERYVTGLTDAGRPFYERERAGIAAEDAADLDTAVGARDLYGARLAVDDERSAWGIAARAYEIELDRRGAVSGPGARELIGMANELDEIEELLRRLSGAQAGADPATPRRSAELAGEQQALEDRLAEAEIQARELARMVPVRPQGMHEALDDARGRMAQATDDLGGNQPMQAEGSQGVAAQRIQDAIDALEQAQQQAREMAQSQQGREGDKDDRTMSQRDDDRSSQAGEANRQDLEIPGPEEFRTPEEYRRALLEGMEGEVPEEYRAMKRRYYEELVLQ
jgi:hypothetical protein